MNTQLNTHTDDVIASDRVQGTAVYSTVGDKLGSIDGLMINKQSGQVRYAVMEFGGFFDKTEAETGAFASGELMLEGVKALEEAREGVGGQAWAVVADSDDGGVVGDGEADADGGVGR